MNMEVEKEVEIRGPKYTVTTTIYTVEEIEKELDTLEQIVNALIDNALLEVTKLKDKAITVKDTITKEKAIEKAVIKTDNIINRAETLITIVNQYYTPLYLTLQYIRELLNQFK